MADPAEIAVREEDDEPTVFDDPVAWAELCREASEKYHAAMLAAYARCRRPEIDQCSQTKNQSGAEAPKPPTTR